MSIPKKVLNTFIKEFDVARAASKLSPENAGGRLVPSRTTKNDAKSNLRADQGAPHSKDPDTFSVNVQANVNAENSSVRKFAEQNADVKLFSFDMKKSDKDDEQRVKEEMEKAAKAKGLL